MTEREKLIELLMQQDTKLCDGCSQWPASEAAVFIADHLIANGVTVKIQKEKPPTDLTGKCGSCFFAKHGLHFGKSPCYVECTNEDLLKSRPNRGKASAVRARTTRGCKRYTPMPKEVKL